jgi:hypothetical protein
MHTAVLKMKIRNIRENTEAEIKNLPKKRAPGKDRFMAGFYQIFKEEITSVLPKLLSKIEGEETLLNSFYRARSTLMPKPDEEKTKKESY